MKVKDCLSVAPRVRTRLLATRCRALGEPDDSRIAKQGVHGEPEFRPRLIASLACTVVMPAAVQLDGELCARTIEIQDVTVERMLAAKSVSCEIPVS